ncbi:LysR family transcriptional regulator [Coraliomargarita parva]|uniref:LysR family transcriptional regulator n=1 Tax=Coraliomargarita parva TaxID=3014050 RepID=UPI0022B37E18|nr:LysR family transcriptional regulator [Coraliomargarita parva]
MNDLLPSLTALRAFESVCRCGSVKAAARELNVTPGAISRQIHNLSAELDTRLFERIGNRLELTKKGKQVQQAASEAFGLIRTRLEAIRREGPGAPIILGCTAAFAIHWLLPRLHKWSRLHPEQTLSIVPLPENDESGLRALDAWIDQGRRPKMRTAQLEPFRKNIAVLTMSPAFAEKHGPLHSVEDLRPLPFIMNTIRPESLDDWINDQHYAQMEDHTAPSSMRDDLSMLIQSTKVGLGYMIAPESYIETELEEGSLIAPFGRKERAVPAYLAWDTRRTDEARLKTLLEWLRSEGNWAPQSNTDSE